MLLDHIRKLWSRILPSDPQHRAANATVILAVATLAVSIISLLTWCTLNKQLDEMRESFAADRAYFLFASFSRPSGDVASGQTLTFTFRNYGRTPADLRANMGSCKYARDVETELHSLFSEEPRVLPGLTDTRGFVTPNFPYDTGKEFSPSYQMEVTETELTQARGNIGGVFCGAVVFYDDMRGNHHKTGVCFLYNFGLRAFLFSPDPRWNFHT
jgi:hypothetical protein